MPYLCAEITDCRLCVDKIMKKEEINQQIRRPYVKAEIEVVDIELRGGVMSGSDGTGAIVNGFEPGDGW